MEVACGQCLGCRCDRRLMWAIRVCQEAFVHECDNGNSWVTLTYRSRDKCTPEQLRLKHHVPMDLSLDKSHFQNFIKRLRKQTYKYFACVIDGEHKNICINPIRYFYCGEYGDENLRPHYHACLFNVTFDDTTIYETDDGITTFVSPTLQALWPYGFSTIGELNYDTAAYTAGYCLKKITGSAAADHYLRSDSDGVASWVLPEYCNMSLKPGIGVQYFEQFMHEIFPSDEICVPGKGIVQSVPRYYQTLLERSNPEILELVKTKRDQWIKKNRDQFTPERLKAKYDVQKAKLGFNPNRRKL